MEKGRLRRGTSKNPIFGHTDTAMRPPAELPRPSPAFMPGDSTLWPVPNHAKKRNGWLDTRPSHQVLVGRIIWGFPLDDSRGFAGINHMQVTRWEPAVWDHLDHDVVGGWPLVGHHHPHLKPIIPQGRMELAPSHSFQQNGCTQISISSKDIKGEIMPHLPQISNPFS